MPVARRRRASGGAFGNLKGFSFEKLVIDVVEEVAEEKAAERERGERLGVTARSPRRPAQVTATQDNYDPGSYDALVIDLDAARTFTGFRGGIKGRYLLIINESSFALTLAHQNAGSDAANRIISYTGADLILAANQAAQLWYDNSALRWRILGH